MATPLYRHVYETLIRRIAGGELAPGAMLPSETELGAQLGVSQGTARKALGELERRGIVERRQGRGTFVALRTPESALFHFFRLRSGSGEQVFPELVSETVRRRAATPGEAAELPGLDGEVYEIARLRAIEGRPRIRETSVLPCRLFPGLAERAPLPNTLYALFQRCYGIAVARAEERLQAVGADAADAAALAIAEGAPLMEARRQAIDISDRVVEFRLSRYLTDGLHYSVRLT